MTPMMAMMSTWGRVAKEAVDQILLESLSPADFGTIVGEVNLEFDQPKVAELLAKQLRGGVTAAHIIEANRKAAENQPPSIIAKLATSGKRCMKECTAASMRRRMRNS